MGRLSGPIAAELNLPSISHLRDIVGLSAQAVADLNCHRRLLAVSHATRTHHVAGGLAAAKTFVVYNGVDLERFHPRPPSGYVHRELGLSSKKRFIGVVGQIGPRKGQDVLLRAAAIIADTTPDVHYLVIGKRHSEKDESRQFENDLHTIAAASLRDRVHFLGVCNDMEQRFGELTLLVHPARQEPLGRVLLEAAASGAAILATDVGGTSEIFPKESDAARLVPPNDPQTLADAMRSLLDDRAERKRLSDAARRRAEEQFDIRTAVAALLRHYGEVLSHA
jgi:glycosyltransferase involved in cell wall biosynthesis